MICLSLQNKNLQQILSILERPDVEMAEIRLDSCPLGDDDIVELFTNCSTPLIATFRTPAGLSGRGNAEAWQEACTILDKAVIAGARFLDIDISAPADISRHFQKLCRDSGAELIRSFHDFKGTPDINHLQQIMQRCARYGADIVKIVTTAGNAREAEFPAELYKSAPRPLTAFAMGEAGRKSRLDCLRYGAPFTYACLSEEEATAPGQWTLDKMNRAVYGDMKPYLPEEKEMPASKSFAQRAIIAATLAEGTSVLSGYTPCGDTEAAIRAAKALGAEVTENNGTLKIKGTGGTTTRPERIDVGESGLLSRLLIPILSVGNTEGFSIDGRGTLLKRPLDNAQDIMAAFGVLLSQLHIPVKVRGSLIPGRADIPGRGGSQLISGLLMALPLCEKDSSVYVGEPKSLPYMFITADVLKKFGIVMTSELEGDEEMIQLQDWSYCSGITFGIPGGQRYKAASFRIEADWSSAANFLVAGAVFGNVSLTGLDDKSLQADLSILDILVDAGACVSKDEDTGAICVRKAPLEAFETDLNHAPDLFPIVSVLAAFCQGTSRIEGVRRLHGKESDRAAAILEMLSRMGVSAATEGDSLVIEGESLVSRRLNDRLLHGGEYLSHNDHRMVMALKVAGLGADSPIIPDNEECVAKSYPGFRL